MRRNSQNIVLMRDVEGIVHIRLLLGVSRARGAFYFVHASDTQRAENRDRRETTFSDFAN